MSGFEIKTSIPWVGIMGLFLGTMVSASVLATMVSDEANPEGLTPLHMAVENGDVAQVRDLIARGASVNAVTDFGETPLHFVDRREDVAMSKKIEIVNQLIGAGADVNARMDDDGRSALFFVTRPIAEVLVPAGADVNLKSNSGMTAVQWLAYSNAHPEIEYLISQGADVNYQDSKDGKSALHIAANWGYVDTAKVLLVHGADVNQKDKDGWTPLHWAVFEGGPEMEKCLKENGAKPLSGPEIDEILKLRM
ncbi:MAG: ankyrin repeat domain-containing protein [Candidatus Omnitrophica bacterium]|nr:ankyrin repeat domain-containing protein [Candidatus Omnitrophota bacterium]MDD5672286.1 ankyrin repeat domain-containing protein [Candidatus Omnitrophota bacterium]